ncbi:MAG TPA: septum formation initiator family protein [Candidatus Babeliales bacterium]|nr:septum formation initiator family protein [Candidatus Babeliales bacterium]
MVIRFKYLFLRLALCVEIMVLAAIYFYGSYGVQTLAQLRTETAVVEQEVMHLQQEVAILEHELNAWNSNPFYKEKVAREQLQMAREGDTIYYLS